MNILITGASRGIGAAAYALLNKHGHRVVGHSTKGRLGYLIKILRLVDSLHELREPTTRSLKN